MTDYRMVARHVRYWRGAVHRWSTVYPFTGSISAGNYAAAIAALKTMEQSVLYDDAATGGGGLYEIALYDHSTGGVPVAVATYFPWATPGSWVPYTSSAWGSRTTLLGSAAETAMQVEWLAGLSSSGKPVTFKKWYHSVPETGGVGSSPDIGGGIITTLSAAFVTGMSTISGLGITLGNSRRLAATTPTIRNFYGNHQMPRGRRRVSAASARANYSAILQYIEGQNDTSAGGA